MGNAPRTRLRTLIDTHRDEILSVAALHHGVAVSVFGSIARGEDGPDSDIDLLVEFAPGTRPLELLALEADLEQALGVKVDIGTPESLKPAIRDRVLAEAVPL